MKAFNHISENIGGTYKDLTKSPQFPLGGQAYLDMEDSSEPYLAGLKYHAMPPLKRFRDMEHLSGGEKTIAALALLFAIHSYQPSPFFVLDEVDAALDNVNVARVARYVREHAGPGMQFVVISLKQGFFQESEALVGVLRDQGRMTSRYLSLDVSRLRHDAFALQGTDSCLAEEVSRVNDVLPVHHVSGASARADAQVCCVNADGHVCCVNEVRGTRREECPRREEIPRKEENPKKEEGRSHQQGQTRHPYYHHKTNSNVQT